MACSPPSPLDPRGLYRLPRLICSRLRIQCLPLRSCQSLLGLHESLLASLQLKQEHSVLLSELLRLRFSMRNTICRLPRGRLSSSTIHQLRLCLLDCLFQWSFLKT